MGNGDNLLSSYHIRVLKCLVFYQRKKSHEIYKETEVMAPLQKK